MPDQSARNPAIILVEDEPDILIILHRLMRDLTGGYDIVTVNGGAEALAQIALRPVPLVITDYNMPGMNGIEVVSAIGRARPGLPCIILSAHREESYITQALSAGARGYITKELPLAIVEGVERVLAGEVYLSEDLRK